MLWIDGCGDDSPDDGVASGRVADDREAADRFDPVEGALEGEPLGVVGEAGGDPLGVACGAGRGELVMGCLNLGLAIGLAGSPCRDPLVSGEAQATSGSVVYGSR